MRRESPAVLRGLLVFCSELQVDSDPYFHLKGCTDEHDRS